MIEEVNYHKSIQAWDICLKSFENYGVLYVLTLRRGGSSNWGLPGVLAFLSRLWRCSPSLPISLLKARCLCCPLLCLTRSVQRWLSLLLPLQLRL